MLSPIPREELQAKLSASNYSDVYVFVWQDEKWDVLLADTDYIPKSDNIACQAGTDIHGHDYCRVAGIEKYATRAYPTIDMIFAAVVGKDAATAFFHKVNEVARQYDEDIKGPMLKMHTALAVLAASVADD